MPGICSKSEEKLEFVLKALKKIEICKFNVSRFTLQDVIYKKMSFASILNINTNTVIQSQIDLGFHCFLPGNNLENTWNFMSQEKWEPCLYFNTLNCYKSVII